MATVRQILEALDRVAPTRFAFSFDKVGLQVGSPDQQVKRAVVSLDRSLGAAAHCKQSDAQLLLAHHPLIFQPLTSVDTRSHVGRTVLELARNDISFIAAHTNWDSARGGINDTLAQMLGLVEVKAFGSAAQVKQLKLIFFAPADVVDRVIDAASDAGAGVIGEYKRCAFLLDGRGTFIGHEGSNPTIGEPCQVEVVDEVRVEMVMPAERASAVTKAITKAHPYEEPAYDLVVQADLPEQPAGRVGRLEGPTSLAELVQTVEAALNTRACAWGAGAKKISRVAVVGGSADEEWMNAQRAGADVLVTGEVKQHVALEASESGMCLVAAGHYATEHPGCATLRQRMEEAVPDVQWLLFEPSPGSSGRPL